MPPRLSAVERIRAQIDELFASEQDLGQVLEEVARLSVRLVVQAAVEAEVCEFLGRDRYQRGDRDRVGYRNGHTELTVKTTAGPVVLERPKLRGTTEPFTSRLLGKGVSRTNALEALVLSGFVRGLSVRDVEAALAEALGPEAALSKSTVSRVCEQVKTEFDAWKLRDLGGIELEYLFLDGSHFRMHPGARAEPVLCAWGITTQGTPLLVGLAPGAHEGHDPWASFLGELVERGLRAPLLVITDGAPGLIGAVELVLANSLRQRCLVHRSRKESTWRCIGVGWCCGEKVGCGAVAGGCWDGRVAFLLEEGPGLADDVADGGPADVAESIGEDVQGAQVSLVEDGEQDTLAVADLLREHPEAGTRLAWTATPLMVEAVRLGRLPHGESLGERV